MKIDSLRWIASTSNHSRWSITKQLTWLYAVSASIMLIFASGFLYWILLTTLEKEDEQLLDSRIKFLGRLLQADDRETLEREISQENGGFTNSQYSTYTRILNESGITLQLISRYERYLAGVLLTGILVSAAIGAIIARRGMKPLADITGVAERITASQLHERIDVVPWPQELVSLARAFDAMLDRLEDSFDRLFQFSADLAHELRTPINNLRGEAEVALSRPREAHEYREILASSLEEYDRLSRMMDSLLFLARADNAQAMVTRSRIDVRTEVTKVINFYEALAADQKVRVICMGDGTMNADPILFRRIISNLLSNALHYTPSGGEVAFSIQCVDDGIEVVCRDSGAGIAQEHLSKIFDRFYRVNPSRNTKKEGAGLGLAIVKSIVGLHSGKIGVQSTIGQGTSIQLFFPI